MINGNKYTIKKLRNFVMVFAYHRRNKNIGGIFVVEICVTEMRYYQVKMFNAKLCIDVPADKLFLFFIFHVSI